MFLLNIYSNVTVKENILKALDISWKGILSIFIAMTIIFLTIVILNKITHKKEDEYTKRYTVSSNKATMCSIPFYIFTLKTYTFLDCHSNHNFSTLLALLQIN